MGMPTFQTNATARTAQQQPVEKPKHRTNGYGGKCRRCSGWVEAGQGRLDKIAGAWVVEHVECPSVAVAAGPQEGLFEQNFVNGTPLFDGIYTLDLGDRHRTFRLRTQSLDDAFMPGVQILQYLNGLDNEHDYTSFGHIKSGRLSVWKRFRGNGLEGDAKTFIADPTKAEASVNCYRCGRTLTVPASIHNGLGPECARKGM